MQNWWFSDRVSHAGIWLLYFLLAWSYYYSWLPLNGLHIPPQRLFVFTVNTVLLTLLFPYFLYWFRKHYSQHWHYILRVAVHALLMLAASAFLGLLDAVYLFDQTKTDFLFTPWHLSSRYPTLLVLSMIINWLFMKRDFEAHKKQQVILENARQEAELRMLKAQISPHFLFNSLNNLHSLIHLDPARASDTVVKLSDLLRHVIYDGHRASIPLDEELYYLQNYIALAALKERLQQHIKFKIDTESGHSIEPLILVNFIENAFKHGSIQHADELIEISLTAKNGRIVFSCTNAYNENLQKDNTHGIGMANVKQRLEMAYPNHHRLEIRRESGKFYVQLEIETQ
jgi:two-component system, LytTR family, sensor kinase